MLKFCKHNLLKFFSVCHQQLSMKHYLLALHVLCLMDGLENAKWKMVLNPNGSIWKVSIIQVPDEIDKIRESCIKECLSRPYNNDRKLCSFSCNPAGVREPGTLRCYEPVEQKKCKLLCVRAVCRTLCKTVIYNKCESK